MCSLIGLAYILFFFSSRRRHTRFDCDWSSDVCSSDLYIEWFWDLVQRHGSDRSLVHTATLTLRYDIATNRPLLSAPQFIESPFTCDARITDVRGKNYLAHFDGWWYQERLERPQSESIPWWKFWGRSRRS